MAKQIAQTNQQDTRTYREKIRFIVYPVVLAWLVTMMVRPIISDGSDMFPTIENGQVIIVSKTAYDREDPKLYDVVAFRKDFAPTEEKGSNIIRRVIGAPGDTLRIRNGKVFRNGVLLSEGYLHGMETPGNIGPITVGENQIFVLGDNRIESLDSRNSDIGLLSVDLLRGKVVYRIWPLLKISPIR